MPKKLPRMIAELPLRPVRLLHRTGYIGKSVVRVRSDQSYRAHNQNQDHGQHYRVLSNILPRVFRPILRMNSDMHSLQPLICCQQR